MADEDANSAAAEDAAAAVSEPVVDSTEDSTAAETGDAGEGGEGVDAEIEEMKERVKAMEEEAKKLSEMQNEVEKELSPSAEAAAAEGGTDDKSVYVGQVDYEATPEELQALFQSCGTINRVTILCNKHTGNPKGFAYVEFLEPEAVQTALLLNESPFRGRNITVKPKRVNTPRFMRGKGKGKGKGKGRGRGKGRGYRGGWRGRAQGYHPYY